MTDSKLRKVTIDRFLFKIAFDRDVDFNDTYPRFIYLNLETGEILWVYEEDDDAEMEAGIAPEQNRALRDRVESNPDGYLEIPGLDHGDHHEILREFLDSDWTTDEQQRTNARNAYSGSIGRWKRAVDNRDVVHAYYAFQERKTEQMADEFLNEHGIDPVWK